jgi:hypothetical protein
MNERSFTLEFLVKTELPEKISEPLYTRPFTHNPKHGRNGRNQPILVDNLK